MIKKYKCLSNQVYKMNRFSIETVQPDHIEKIRKWRNSQIHVLRQSNKLTSLQQKKYFRDNIWPDMLKSKPKNIIFIYKENNKIIGYGGLVNISWESYRAEISFLLDTKLAGTLQDTNIYLPNFLIFMKEIAFNYLNLNRLWGETFSIRPKYIHALEKSGFFCEGNLKNHIWINGKAYDLIINACIKTKNKLKNKNIIKE